MRTRFWSSFINVGEYHFITEIYLKINVKTTMITTTYRCSFTRDKVAGDKVAEVSRRHHRLQVVDNKVAMYSDTFAATAHRVDFVESSFNFVRLCADVDEH